MSPSQRSTLRSYIEPAECTVNRRRFSQRRSWIPFAAAAGLATVVLLLVVWVVRSDHLFPSSQQELAYTAPIDHYRTVPLTDGSEMVLSARAVAKVAFTRDTRAVEVLQGAAYFQVERDARRPFVVRAGEVSVTAIGTAFSVNRETDSLSVTVTEGSVKVAHDSDTDAAPMDLRVETGGRALIPVRSHPSRRTASPIVTTGPVDPVARATSSLQFFNTPLGDVIAAINTQTKHRILIDDPRVTDLNFSGTVLRERIDEWVATLPQIYPLRQVPLEDGSVTLVLRSQP
jgi:transmembrane sensor